MKNLPLGELLKNLGYISEYQLREVLEYQKIPPPLPHGTYKNHGQFRHY